MSAVFLLPVRASIVASNATTVTPAANVLDPEPALIMKTSGNTATLTILKAAALIDTVSLFSNASASATVRVRTGNDANITTANYDESFSAWSGPASGARHNLIYHPMAAASTDPYVRIDISDPSVAQLEISHLIIGKRLEFAGIREAPEITPLSGTETLEGFGWMSVYEGRTRTVWKCAVDAIDSASYYSDWAYFVRTANIAKHFLFIASTDDGYFQPQSFVMRNQVMPKAVPVISNNWTLEFTLLEV